MNTLLLTTAIFVGTKNVSVQNVILATKLESSSRVLQKKQIEELDKLIATSSKRLINSQSSLVDVRERLAAAIENADIVLIATLNLEEKRIASEISGLRTNIQDYTNRKVKLASRTNLNSR